MSRIADVNQGELFVTEKWKMLKLADLLNPMFSQVHPMVYTLAERWLEGVLGELGYRVKGK